MLTVVRRRNVEIFLRGLFRHHRIDNQRTTLLSNERHRSRVRPHVNNGVHRQKVGCCTENAIRVNDRHVRLTRRHLCHVRVNSNALLRTLLSFGVRHHRNATRLRHLLMMPAKTYPRILIMIFLLVIVFITVVFNNARRVNRPHHYIRRQRVRSLWGELNARAIYRRYIHLLRNRTINQKRLVIVRTAHQDAQRNDRLRVNTNNSVFNNRM